MKVLVATSYTQGVVPGDYQFTVEGELVTTVTMPCDDHERCGCSRGFAGLASARATTTAMVVERDGIDPELLAMAVLDSMERQGWTLGLDPLDIEDLLADHLDELEMVCSEYPIGTVVGRVGDLVYTRGLMHMA